eukprot:m51a1_g3276 putative dna-binding protein smubp-2-like (1010) ;mRNA; f:238715-246641
MSERLDRFLRLIAQEREAEESESSAALTSSPPLRDLEARGVALLRLRATSLRSALCGRWLLRLEPMSPAPSSSSSAATASPAHRITCGDMVALLGGCVAAEAPLRGVVWRVRSQRVSVALDAEPAPELLGSAPLALVRVGNEVTYRRMREALERARGPAKTHPLARALLLGEASVLGPCEAPQPQAPQRERELLGVQLNDEQWGAVRAAESTRDVALIHGPPGTGKTATVAELIARLAKNRGESVLVCAPSNIAVDNVAERLAPLLMVRIGHPARVMPELEYLTLDARVKRTDTSVAAGDARAEASKKRQQLRTCRSTEERSAIRSDLSELYKEIRRAEALVFEREAKAVKEVFLGCRIVLATLTGAGDSLLDDHPVFDWVVIDEAAQALEPACWIALLRGAKCVMAGDDRQLPPTIKSEEAAAAGLSVTLFERLRKQHGDSITRLLRVQYRMNERIMKWASDAMYEGKLIADPSVRGHLLKELPGIAQSDVPALGAALQLIDTAGCSLHESVDTSTLGVMLSESKFNEGEATIHAQELAAAGVKPADIGVIAPYSAQVSALVSLLSPKFPGLEISTVDGFQGREKEAIVITMVRSQPTHPGEVGFLREDRRTNVAITRARRHVAIVCDTQTVGSHPFLAKTAEYFSENATASAKAAAAKRAPKKQAAAQKKQPEQAPVPRQQTSAGAPREDVASAAEESLSEAVRAFASGAEQMKEFPTTLTSRDRALVHSLAEELGLVHGSCGSGEDRRIVLSKKQQLASAPEQHEASPPPPALEQSGGPAATDSATVEEKDTAAPQQAPRGAPKSKSKSKSKQKKHAKKANPRPDTTGMDEIDAALAELGMLPKPDAGECSTTCAFAGPPRACKASVRTMGATCKLCGKKFCFEHFQPEVHGCGAQAKKSARSEWLAQCRQRDRKALEEKLRAKTHKVISKRATPQEDQKAIKEEVLLLHKHHHPNLLMLMGYCETRSDIFVVTEYMEGTLAEFLSRGKPLVIVYSLIAKAFVRLS